MSLKLLFVNKISDSGIRLLCDPFVVNQGIRQGGVLPLFLVNSDDYI